jgi:beta-1,2-mannosidase
MTRVARSRSVHAGAAVALLGLVPACGSLVPGQTEASQQRAASLPSWAIGPFTRYLHNPILTSPVVPAASTEWEWPEVFNPGVVVVKGVFHMLYRGTDFADVSSIGAATSTNGYHFTPVSGHPVIAPSLASENQGVEDPRLYYLAGKYYAFFTGDSGAEPGSAIDINEAVSANGRSWTQLGPVLDNTKDAAVVANPAGTPVLIGGHYLMYYGQFGQTYLAESTNLEHWATVGAVNARLPASDGGYEFCVAVTGYRTTRGGAAQQGIDLFVAGQLMGHGRWYYAISEVDFDRARPLVAAARLGVPALYPQAPYELYGHTPRTVFTNDIIFYKGTWWMYYGAGDSVVALANAALRS